MRILIIKTSALGDIIHALPVLDYLHQTVPEIEIDWVVEGAFADLLRDNPLISKLHTVNFKNWKRKPFTMDTFNGIFAVRNGIVEREYDMVFDIQGNIKSGIICFLSNSKRRFGFTSDRLQERLNLLFTTDKVPMQHSDIHITDQYLRLVSAPFNPDFSKMELKSDIYTSPEDDNAAESPLTTVNSGPVFLFHYGTTWQTKYWNENSWIELGKTILVRYPKSSILFSWGNDAELQTVSKLVAEIGDGDRAMVTKRNSLKQLTALLKKVDLVVGGDTGPVHLAAAVGTATVSYYRASDGKRSGPRGNKHIVIQAPMECTACFRTKCDKDSVCRNSITVQDILVGIEKLLPVFSPSTKHHEKTV